MMADEHPRSQGDDVDCVEVVEIITDYLEGALPERERRRLENHLAACPGCARTPYRRISAKRCSPPSATRQGADP